MKITETLHVTDRAKWRGWLKKNHKSKSEIWLVYYKKHSGKPRIPYDDAVEEAVCFGWIDTNVQRIDDNKYAQKFTPRREGSGWSSTNVRRAEKMISLGRMTAAGLRHFQNAGKNLVPPRQKTAVIPADLRKALDSNKTAQRNFENFAPGYRRDYIDWVVAAKRDETRLKRIKAVVERAAKNTKPGML